MKLSKDLKIKGKVSCGEPLCERTTLRIGGRAAVWTEPRDEEDLIRALNAAETSGMRALIIGQGSNLLVSDKDLDMMAISLGSMKNSDFSADNIECAAGEGLQKFVRDTIGHGLGGLEFLAGIPGTVGGAVRMNAGAGKEGPWISSRIERLKVADRFGKIRIVDKKDVKFSYRHSGLEGHVILGAEFKMEACKEKKALRAAYKRFLAGKKEAQELSAPSAGCIFKNPGLGQKSAGALIDECGFKGKAMGGAMVSRKHANFIINTGKAAFGDVMGLIELIREAVLKRHGILIETEIEIIT